MSFRIFLEGGSIVRYVLEDRRGEIPEWQKGKKLTPPLGTATPGTKAPMVITDVAN
jgi:hypothetical protein